VIEQEKRMKRLILFAALGFTLACGSSETKPAEKAQPVNTEKPAEKQPEKAPEAPAAALTLAQPAPDFTLKDSTGKDHTLSGYKGKYVVLEWVNYGCPFVKRQYSLGAMQKAQKEMTDKGVVWLAVNSSAVGKQGYFEGEELAAQIKANNAAHSAYLLDTDGKVGKTYGAKTTPHMYIVDPEGKLLYQGAIDDPPTADEKVAVGQNFVLKAIEEAMAGKPVTASNTPPYGCGVKYQ
jgi:peroxiredoxin